MDKRRRMFQICYFTELNPVFLHIEFNDFVIRKHTFSSKLIFFLAQLFSTLNKYYREYLRDTATVIRYTLQACEDGLEIMKNLNNMANVQSRSTASLIMLK